jgi:hypothetical protein
LNFKYYLYPLLLFLCAAQGVAQTTTYPVQVNVNLLPPYSLYLSDYYSGTKDKIVVTLINRDQFKPAVSVRLRMIITAPGGIRIQTNENNFYEPVVVETGSPVRLTQGDLTPYFQPNSLITQGFLAAGKLPEGMVEFCFQAVEAFTGQVLSASTCTRAWITSQKPPLLSLPRNMESIAFREPLNVMFQWTPLHQGLALVEYDFILKELWDNGMTPQAAFPYSPEIYRETTRSTSLIYGALQPQLLPGKRYAWCVQAKAREGLDEVNLFQNEGYSEIRWFNLQDNCAPPQVVTATAERSRLNLVWDTKPEHIGFTISYRLKPNSSLSAGESSGEAWKEQQTLESKSTVYGLKNGGTYEYRVGSMCMAGQPVFTSVFSITLPEADSARLAQCGIMPAVNLTNQEPIKELKTSETFQAGDFPITVTRIAGSNGTFTGVGWTTIPWLNDAKIAVEFADITINTDKQMTNGYVQAMYDKTEGQIANLDDVFEGGFDVGTVKTGLTKTDYKFDFSIPGVEAFELNDTGELVITDSEGVAHTVTAEDKEGQGNEGNKVVVFPMTVQDKEGNVYQVEKVTETDSNGNPKEVAKATYLGKISTPMAADSFDPTQLNGDKAIVTFAQGSNAKYAFDTWQDYYGKISLIKSKYQQLYTNYYAPWKFLPTGQSDKVSATIAIKDQSIKPEQVVFKTPTGTTYTATFSNNTYTLQLAAGPAGDVQELYALYPRDSSTYYTLGKISIATYQPQIHKVVLVSVNNVPVDREEIEEIERTLKTIYDSVAVTWHVVRDTFTYNGNYRLMENSTGLSTYNEAMRTLNNAYRAARTNFDSEANYLFFLKATGNTDINNRDLTGFMPRGAQFGYIFTSEIPNIAEAQVVAHELGHGRWKLHHPFDRHYGGFKEAEKTENVMSYGSGMRLAKWQWDIMNDPAMLVSVFEGDDKSQMQNDPILAQIRKRIDELEKSTNLKYFTIVHCDACNNATQESINELKISELLDVPSNELFLESSINVVPTTRLTKIQFIERPGGKCVVLYYAHESGISANVLGSDAFDLGSVATTTKKLYFLSATNSTNCTSFADSWSANICLLTSNNAFTESEQSKNYYTGLFDAINNCLLNQSSVSKILTVSEIESLLQKANSQIRSTQYIEFAQNGLIYQLDDNGKAKLVTDAPSNASINAGEWNEANIEMKMRLGYSQEGILQFEALGINKNLTLSLDKKADVVSVAQNMRDKNNTLFLRAMIKDVETTAKVNPVIINNDEFPDKKKVEVDKDASYLKIVCELGGVGITFLKTAKIEQPVYNEGENYTVKAPPMATGIIESVGMMVTDITSAASTIHDLATDDEARKGAIQGLAQIKDQVVDDPTQLFPILTEVVLEEFTGSTPDEFNEANTAATNEGRKQHIVVKTSVRTASSVFASGKIIVKLPEMAQDIAFKMARSKSFLKFKKLPVPDEVLKNFEDKLKSLPDGGEKFLDDFKDVSDDVRKDIVDDPDLIDSWKELDEDGLDKSVKTNIESLRNPDTAREAVEQSGKSKPTWPEIQALFKRGNDFNKKALSKYTYNEIVLEGIGGKAGKRLDSYIPGKEIVSRKATTLSNIQPTTFSGYLDELITKYPVGSVLNSSKLPKGTKLSGDYFLEIPLSNKSFFESSVEFQKVLSDFNTLKKVDIKIKYLAE